MLELVHDRVLGELGDLLDSAVSAHLLYKHVLSAY